MIINFGNIVNNHKIIIGNYW